MESRIDRHSSFSIVGSKQLLTILSILLVASLYINLTKVFLGGRYYVLLVDAALFLISLGVIVYRLLNNRPVTGIEVITILFLLMGVAQIFNPNVPTLMAGIEGFRRVMFQMLAIFIGVAAVKDRDDIVRVGRLIVLCSIPILLYSIKQFFFMSDFDYAIIESNTASLDSWRIFGKTRAFGIFNGPFHLGLFSGLVFWLTVATHLETKRRVYLLVAVVAVLACLASLTRSSIIALFVSFPIVLFYSFSRFRLRVLLITVLVVGFTFVSAYLLRQNYEEIDMFFESISSLESAMEGNRFTSRFEGYEKGMETLKSHPFGLGMGSAADAMGYYFEPHNKVYITSHNLFLRIALETGWVGLLLFLGIVYQLFAATRNLKRSGDKVATLMLLGPLTVIMIAGVSGSTLGAYPINLVFWSLCGMLVSFSTSMPGKTD